MSEYTSYNLLVHIASGASSYYTIQYTAYLMYTLDLLNILRLIFLLCGKKVLLFILTTPRRASIYEMITWANESRHLHNVWQWYIGPKRSIFVVYDCFPPKVFLRILWEKMNNFDVKNVVNLIGQLWSYKVPSVIFIKILFVGIH